MFFLVGRKPATEIPGLLACADAAFFSFIDTDLFTKTIPAKLQSCMACGMPILASARGESVRIIDEAQCGICCELGNADELARVIMQFQEIRLSDREQMGNNALQYYRGHSEKQTLMNEVDGYFDKYVSVPCRCKNI